MLQRLCYYLKNSLERLSPRRSDLDKIRCTTLEVSSGAVIRRAIELGNNTDNELDHTLGVKARLSAATTPVFF